MREQYGLIQRLIGRSKVLLAKNQEDDEQIFGYIVAETLSPDRPIVHYCYVKEPFRRLGIASKLYATVTPLGEGAWASHWNRRIAKLASEKDLKLKYNPYRR
jgi:GNAT superfamily N-acetyltransferase